MSPLGWPLLVLVSLSVVVAPATAYALWDRGSAQAWRRRTRHVLLFALSQLAAMLFALVAVNHYGDLVTSWGELAGLLTQDASPRHLVATAMSAETIHHFGAPAIGPTASPAPVEPGPAGWTEGGLPAGLRSARWTGWSAPTARLTDGGVAWMTLPGPTTGLSTKVLVFLPPQYFAGLRHLPVVEVFAGFPGTPTALVNVLRYPDLMREALRRHLAGPMILVLAQPSVTYPRDTECTNVVGGEQVLTYWAVDVPRVLTRLLQLSDPTFGAMGNSTGGYCAVKLGVFYPRTFPAVAGLSAYFSAEPDPSTGELFGGSQHYRDLQDLGWRLTHLPQPRLSIFLATSRNETGPDGYATQQRFLALVRAPMSADEFVLHRGFGHTFGTWLPEIPPALAWLSRQLRPW